MSRLEDFDLPPLFAKAEQAMREATAAAIDEHWRAGHPIYVWRDERVVALLPDGRSIPLEKGQYKLDTW